MKIPKQFIITTKEYVQIQTKLNLYIAKFGCKFVEAYLDMIPLRWKKQNGRNIGAYIVNKVCQEYKLTKYELFEANSRHDLTEARQVLCALSYNYIDISHEEISAQFHKSRHFTKRAVQKIKRILEENHPIDQEFIARYKRLDSLVSAYKGFQPKPRKK